MNRRDIIRLQVVLLLLFMCTKPHIGVCTVKEVSMFSLYTYTEEKGPKFLATKSIKMASNGPELALGTTHC